MIKKIQQIIENLIPYTILILLVPVSLIYVSIKKVMLLMAQFFKNKKSRK